MIFKNFEYFLAIVEEGGLSKAAKKLYISQPSLSKYLKRLETNLGLKLFNRDSSPMVLTYVGERYYNYIINIKALEKRLYKEFSEIQSNERGKIRIGIALWRGSILLPELLPIFTANYPDIEVSITEGKSKFLSKELINDDIDFAIMNLPATMDFSRLNYEILMEEEILFAGNVNHPLVKRMKSNKKESDKYPLFDLRSIKDELLILTGPGQNLTSAILHYLSKIHYDPKNVLETANLTTAINLVSEGMGFTFIPEGGAKDNKLPDNIFLFSLNDLSLKWPLAVVYKKNSYITSISNLFIEMLKHYHKRR